MDKQGSAEGNPATETQATIARVAPHAHYPRPTPESYNHRYPHQYSEYPPIPYKNPTAPLSYKDATPTPVKYSEIVENNPPNMQRLDHVPQMMQKPKDKDYLEMCAVQQSHLKYPDHLNYKHYNETLKHPYGSQPMPQYMQKEPQVIPYMSKESHMQYMQKEYMQKEYMQKELLQKELMQKEYMQKEHSQFSPYIPKLTMQNQYPRQLVEHNNFLAHLNKIDPQMAHSIMNDPHLRTESHTREPQMSMYHGLDQSRPYQQPQRMYRTTAMPSGGNYPNRPIPQTYNQSYNFNMKHNLSLPMHPDPYRLPHYPHNMPKYAQEYKMDQQMRERRSYPPPEGVHYVPMPSKVSPTYGQCNQLEYAQHYQHRRPSQITQEYFAHQNKMSCLSASGSEQEGVSTKSNSLKQYLESWNEEEVGGSGNDVSSNRIGLDKVPVLKGPICFKGKNYLSIWSRS